MARNSTSAGETGLLTRFVPEKLKHGAPYRWFLRFVRVLQFLSAVISLGIFSSRVYKVYRLVNSAKTQRGISGAFGAVEGILAAAVAYTILATLIQCIVKARGPRWLRWLWVLLDLAFVGAFIAVAVLTRPAGGPAGPKHCYNNRSSTSNGQNPGQVAQGKTANTQDRSCNLPWGTFILAILSTILHAITAAFHEVKDRMHEHRQHKAENEGQMGTENGQSANGQNGHSATGQNGYPATGQNGHSATGQNEYAPNV
ncbi:hypothetical protein K504DRAFT_424930 [Pleomassaria siparia CBS 279.74]|uniref:MARVEL domain-containing protein n=1 Tax=Pleomassaria siparia CBS 279.74 TaxID=1314801 RepID=A0A6G1KN46_9PLEO|nr:hypothetical protein K504DRAFT_424930 [Pleomassaria siparia CBS 279.74]